jgi:hypothetical protein
LALQRTAGNAAVTSMLRGHAHGAGRRLQRNDGGENADPEGPTFGNMPRDKPKAAGYERVELRVIDGKWREVRPDGKSQRARGEYAFVVQGDKIYAVKDERVMGRVAAGHTEAAQGGRVNWAGMVRISGNNGQVIRWDGNSGHYRPAAVMRESAVRAGLPADKWQDAWPPAQLDPATGRMTRPRDPDTGEPYKPQLPVEQPRTRPRPTGPANTTPAHDGGEAAPSTGGGTTAKTGAGPPAKGAGAGGTTVPDAGHAAGGNPRARVGPPSGIGGGIEDDAGPDITSEERAAMAMPSNMAAAPGDWTLTGWLMQTLIFARFAEADAEKQRKHVERQIAAQLDAQAMQTMAFQMRGDIAYAQVSTRTTQGGGVSVLELTRLLVSPSFRQHHSRDTDAIAAVTTIDETHSFAITLHPHVKAWAVELLTNRIKSIEAQLQGTAASAQLRTERNELVACRHLVATREVVAFSMLPGHCHKYLPMGTPPPSG